MEVFVGEDQYSIAWLLVMLSYYTALVLTVLVCSHSNASYGVGSFYQGNSTTDATPDVYWLNNFGNLYSSFGMTHNVITCNVAIVTLYELMVVPTTALM